MSGTEWAMLSAIAAVALTFMTNLHVRVKALETAKNQQDGKTAVLAQLALEKAAAEQALTARAFLELSERVAATMPSKRSGDA